MDDLHWQVFNAELLFRYIINLLSMFILVRWIYFRLYRRSDMMLTYFSFNTIIFFVAFMLNRVEMTTGAAFGLFAVFSILRYRTEGISIKDMTYLFLSIALGLLISIGQGTHLELIGIALIILGLTLVLESGLLFRRERSKQVQYDNIRFLHPDHHDALLADLKERTGLNISRFHIEDVDFLKDSCTIILFYVE